MCEKTRDLCYVFLRRIENVENYFIFFQSLISLIKLTLIAWNNIACNILYITQYIISGAYNNDSKKL